MLSPEVTIIMPMRDVEAYVGEALDSVCSQDYSSIEVLVIDDSSTDMSAAVVRSCGDRRVRLLENQGAGISAAFNTGLEKARGQYVMRCDADDWFVPGRIARQVAWMEAHPDVDAVCGLNITCWEDGSLVREPADLFGGSRCISGHVRQGRQVPRMWLAAFKTSVLRELKGCRTYFETCEDDDLMLRLAEQFSLWHVPEVVYKTRLRRTSTCRMTSQARLQWFVARCYEFRQQRLETGADAIDRGEAAQPPEFPGSRTKPAEWYAQDYLLGDAWRYLDRGMVKQALTKTVQAMSFAPLRTTCLSQALRLFATLIRRGGRPRPKRNIETECR
jgi:glycosyltransferase involved in cell wall biosynthesis